MSRPTKVPGGYTYRGWTITADTWSRYGRKRGSARRGAMGMIHSRIWRIDNIPGSWYTRLKDATARIDRELSRCDCMTEDPGDGFGERVATHSMSSHPEGTTT
jgi:hypothetical protein